MTFLEGAMLHDAALMRASRGTVRVFLFITMLTCLLFVQGCDSDIAENTVASDNATAAHEFATDTSDAAEEAAVAEGEESAVVTPSGKTISGALTIEQTDVSAWGSLTVLFASTPSAATLYANRLDLADLPITITPAIDVYGKWVSSRELRLYTRDRYEAATEYTITIKPEVHSQQGDLLQGQGVVLAAPLLVETLQQISYTKDGISSFELCFSHAVSAEQVRKHLLVEDDAGKNVAIAFAFEEPKQCPVISSAAPLNKRLRFTVAKGISIGAGTVPMAVAYSEFIVPTSMLQVNRVSAQETDSYPWKRYINLEFSNSLSSTNIKEFITLEPALDFTVEADGPSRIAIHGDFNKLQRLIITIRKGLISEFGALDEDFTTTLVMKDFRSRMEFPVSEGTILSPLRPTLIPVNTLNVDKMALRLWRVEENNIPLMAMGFFDSYQKELSKFLGEQEAIVDGRLNEPTRRAVDVLKLANGAKGVFLLEANNISNRDSGSDYEDYDDYYDDYYYYGGYRRLVLITDIGLTARVAPKGITVWANSIATVNPLKGATVRVWSDGNQLIAEGRTDAEGLFSYTQPDQWERVPAIVTIQSGDDLSYLLLSGSLESDSSFDTGGVPYPLTGYELYGLMPREIFRPGESVDATIVLRDTEKKPPKPFPLAWEVRSSRDRIIAKGTSMLTAEGGAAIQFDLPAGAPTGRYYLRGYVPGKVGTSDIYMRFSVEDFAPPRIEVAVSTVEEAIMGVGEHELSLVGKYLFGAPTVDAAYETSMTVTAQEYSHVKWGAFAFGDREKSFYTISTTLDAGTLDSNGKKTVLFTASDTWDLPSLGNIRFLVRVREDGGRWVGKAIHVPYVPRDTQLGLELPQEIEPSKASSVRIAAVTYDGEVAAISEVDFTLSRILTHYNRVGYGSSYRYERSEEFVPIIKKPVRLANGVATESFTVADSGYYLIKIVDSKSGAVTSRRVSVWSGSYMESTSSLMDRVTIGLDKEKFAPGEVAAVKINAPYAGRLLLTVEGAKEEFRTIVQMTGSETIVSVPITTAMGPNSYISAWVIRPVLEGEEWAPHRAFAVVPLFVDMSPQRLHITMNVPQEIQPKTPVPLSLQVRDYKGTPVRGEVTVALVDEALLQLTNYSLSDPFDVFYAKRALHSRFMDMYDALMPLESRTTKLLLAGGGGEDSMGGQRATLNRTLELLSIFTATLQTDSEGRIETTLNLPEYSGRARLMVIAYSQDRFGVAQQNMPIARDVTVEFTLPRAVASGDTFTAPILVFGVDDAPRTAKLEFRTEGPLQIKGSPTHTVTLGGRTGKMVSFTLPFVATEEVGMAKFIMRTTIEGSKNAPFEQTMEVPVRPPYPRVHSYGFGQATASEATKVSFAEKYLLGSKELSLTITARPGIELAQAIAYLSDYPYGCLEQTTSKAWPYLVVPGMLKDLDPAMAEDTVYKQATRHAVQAIIAMQLGDGSFGYWPGVSRTNVWGSIYAAHFLTEAKKTGYVPEDALQSALNYVRQYVSYPSRGTENELSVQNTAKAYACYVLALNEMAPLGWMQVLKDDQRLMQPSGRIFLAGAYALHQGNAKALQALGSTLGSGGFMAGASYSYESHARNNALLLLMWASVDPLAAETSRLAQAVSAGQKSWRTTQDNSFTVLAMGKYLEKTASLRKPFTGTVTNNKGVVLGEFSHTKPLTLQDISDADSEGLSINVQGEGSAFYGWHASGIQSAAPKAESQGIKAWRVWQIADANGVATRVEENSNIKIPFGSKVVVTIFVDPALPVQDLIIADILPGGFEIENPRLVADGGEDEPRATNSWGTHVEMRDDRMLFFAEEVTVSKKPQEFSYVVRAVSKGTYVVPPLLVEGMYAPDVRAISKSSILVIE